VVKTPLGAIIGSEWHTGQLSADHVDGNGIFPQDGIVEGVCFHFAGFHQLPIERANLQTTEHVCGLIKRDIPSLHGSSNFRGGIASFMADIFHQKIDGFLSGHGTEVKAQRENYPRTPMGTPEEHADTVLGRCMKIQIPQQHFPIQSPTFHQKRRAKESPVGSVAIGHEQLQMMSGYEFMMDGGFREMNIVAPHAHELVAVFHRVGGKGDGNHFTPGKVGIHLLTLGSHHLHAPDFLGQGRDGQQRTLFQKINGFMGQLLDQLGLLPRRHVFGFDVVVGSTPIVAEAKFARGAFALPVTPFEFLPGNPDQCLRCVGHHFILQ